MATDDEVAGIEVDKDSHVAISWADGTETRLGLVTLRQACPCAGCRNERDRGRAPLSPLGARHLAVVDARLVGAWGLGIDWSDGHSTGIYSWELLRSIPVTDDETI